MPSHGDELPETQPQFEFDDDDTDVENVPNGDLLQKPVAFLIFDENGTDERRKPVYGDGETIIGRDPVQCQIAIERSANISTVSRVHAKIFYEKGTHFIETLSTNSNTKLNKTPLMHGRIYAIPDGTLLTFGTVRTRYVVNSKYEEAEDISDDAAQNVDDLQLNATVDPNDHINETSPLNGDQSHNSNLNESVTSPTTALTTSVVKETPQSADKDDDGLLLRLVESSPDGSPEEKNASDVREKLDFSHENPLSETQDLFQTTASSITDVPNGTPKSRSYGSSPEMMVPRLRRLANITPIRAVVSPSAVAIQREPSVVTMEVDPVPDRDAQLAETQAYLSNDPTPLPTSTAPLHPRNLQLSPHHQSPTPKTQWTASTELAALIKGHEELNTVPDILKSYTPRKKPDLEYDFESDNQEKNGEKSGEKDRPVVTPVVTRAKRGKKGMERMNVDADESANMTPPTSALGKYRFEYFDPKSSGKRRSGRTPRTPAVVAKKTPKVKSETPANEAPSTKRKRKVAKEESAETSSITSPEMTTPLRRSSRNVKRIQYASPSSRSEAEVNSDSDERPLIELVPKRASNVSRESTGAKRAKIETDTRKSKRKKKSSVEVGEKAAPNAESSSDDNAPLIVFRRDSTKGGKKGEEKKKKKEEKKKEEKKEEEEEKVVTKPKEVEDSSPSPVEGKTTPIRRGKKMKVVLKTLKEDAPSSPLHTPVDRRRIRKPQTKFEELADESMSPDQDEAVSFAATPARLDMSTDGSGDLTPSTPKLARIQSQTTPTNVARGSAIRQKISGTRVSSRIKSGSDDVGILLSSACMQDEELLKIAEELGEARTISEATHFVANQARRTSKLVASVARGIPIVTSEWLLACKRKEKLVDTKEFTLTGDVAGCDLRDAVEKSRNGWLSLDGWSIARTQRAEPSAEEMKEVVKAAGGKLVDSLTEECSLLVAHNDDREDPLVKSAIKRRIPIVQGRMLYQAILEHRTDFKNPRLALKFL